MVDCACGSGKDFAECCEKFLTGKMHAETPEELMRSRYTAYTIPFIPYIDATMRDAAAKDFNPTSAEVWAKSVTWQKLEVLNTEHDETKGIVEFKAYYFDHQRSHIMHEISEFKRYDGKWYYVDGQKPHDDKFDDTKKIGRNDACPCGSGKKYKKCCLAKS